MAVISKGLDRLKGKSFLSANNDYERYQGTKSKAISPTS